MKTRKRLTERQQVTIAIAFTVLFYLAIGIFIYSRFHTKSVRPGISLDDAKKIVDENEGYYIIREDYSTGIDWYIGYGKDEGIEVWIEGETPTKDLGMTFLFGKHNSFLVKGTEYNEECKGVPIMEAMMNAEPMYTLEIESWEIITPIQRDYNFGFDYEGKDFGRLLYPTDYLDQYDIDHGDYAPEGWK